MNTGWGRGSTLLLAAALGITFLLASAVQAQVIHPDQMIGSPAPQKEAIPEGGVMSNKRRPSIRRKGLIVRWSCRKPVLPAAWT